MASSFPLQVVLSAVDRVSSPLDRMGGKLVGFGTKARRVGRDLTVGATLPLVAAGAAAITFGADFERGMNRVRALTGQTREEIEPLKQLTRDLGLTTAFSAGEAARGAGFLAQAGLDVRDSLSVLPPVLDLAVAGELELAEAADKTTDIVKSQGIAFENTAKVADLVVAGSQSATQTVGQLSEALIAGGSVAASFGVPLQEQVGFLTLIADRGVKAAEGGTAMRRSLSRLANPAGEARDALNELRISQTDLFDEDGNFRGFVNLLELLEDRGASGAQVMKLFGQFTGPALISALRGGSKELRTLTAGLKPNGQAASFAAVQMEGATGATLELKASVEGLGLAVAESGLLEWFTQGVKATSAWVREVAAANPKVLRMGVVVAAVIAVVGPALILFGAMASGVGAITTAVGFLIPVLGTLATFLVSTAIPAVISFGVALFANPIGLVILGIAALIAIGAVLVSKWDAISAFFSDLWAGMKADALSFVDDVVAGLKVIGDFLGFGGDADVPDVDAVRRPPGGGPDPSAIAQVSSSRLAAVAGGGAVGAGAQSKAKVVVDFANAPKGTRIRQEPTDVDLETSLGVTMSGAG